MPAIVLASTSRYRAELLARLIPTFDREAPGVGETALPGEPPGALAARLARSKALAVAARHPARLVIGSDQVAERDGHVLGKPGTPANAREQLGSCSGREVRFHTAICLVDTRTPDPVVSTAADITVVHFRELDAATIERYLERDEPYDCAGSFKVEQLGIALFERVETVDPTALVGLPLIALCRLLRAAGMALP